MGLFFKNLRGIFNTEVMGEAIVETIEVMYHGLKRSQPNLEEHELLAHVWDTRRKHLALVGGGPRANDETSFIETYLFSVLEYPNSVRAMGLHVISKERPDIILKHPQFGSEYAQLVAPVLRAQEAGTLLELYKKKHPNLTSRATAEAH